MVTEGIAQQFQHICSIQYGVVLGCTLGWVPLLLTRRGFGSIFVRLGARFLLWSLVPWGLSLLPVLRPGVLLAPIGCIFVWVPAALGLPQFPPRSVVPWASAWPLVAFAPLGCSRSRLTYRYKLCKNLDERPIGFTAYRFLTLAAAWVSAPSLRVTCFTKFTVAEHFFAKPSVAHTVQKVWQRSVTKVAKHVVAASSYTTTYSQGVRM